jgi:nicotinamide riboside kinase
VKIALIGTSAAGKTTLFEALQKQLSDDNRIVFVEEAARKFFMENRNIPHKERLGVPVQMRIQDRVLENEKQAESKGKPLIICDRSVLDPSIFVIANGDVRGGEQLIDRVKPWLSTYTRFFVLNPADIPNVHDEVRWEDDELRQRIHDIFVEQLKANALDYELVSGSLKTRTDQILHFLRLTSPDMMT